MDATIDDKVYKINRRPSIFVSRNNATVKNDDVVIQCENKRHWGAWDKTEGKHFITIAIFAAETGDPVRLYDNVPEEIMTLLKEYIEEKRNA